MATGREMHLTRQIGEHLVAAELGRLGYIAAPFAAKRRLNRDRGHPGFKLSTQGGKYLC